MRWIKKWWINRKLAVDLRKMEIDLLIAKFRYTIEAIEDMERGLECRITGS